MSIALEIVNMIKVEILQDDSIDIDPNTDLLVSGTLDSMALMRLVSMIESKYSIKVQPIDLVIENFINTKAMEGFIGSQLS